MGCCGSKCSLRKQLSQKWANCEHDECRVDVVIEMLVHGLITLPSAITKVDYEHRVIYSKDITYYVVVCNDLTEVKKIKSDRHHQYVLITRLSYLQILSAVDQSVIVFDYYEVETALL